MKVTTVNHPLISHCLHYLRQKDTPSADFKRYCHLVTQPVVLKATENLPTIKTQVETPLEITTSELIEGMPVWVPILRAGLGMLKIAQEIFPEGKVGHLGLERDEETAQARTYYQKFPDLDRKPVIVLDPMLATGGSANQAISCIKEHSKPLSITLACIVAAPEGIDAINKMHPDVQIVTASVDRELNDVKYILPGLGDFGDRYFDT